MQQAMESPLGATSRAIPTGQPMEKALGHPWRLLRIKEKKNRSHNQKGNGSYDSNVYRFHSYIWNPVRYKANIAAPVTT